MRLALAVTLAFVSFVTWQTGFDPRIATWSNPPAASAWAYWAPVIRGVTMFSAGWLVYLSYLKRDALAALAIVATDAIAVLFLLILLAASLGMTTRHVTLLLFPFLILGLTDGGSITARLLASRPVHFLGLISYSIYLLHFPISDILILRFPVLDAVDGLRLCLTIAVTLVVSTLSYYLIEAPARRLLRRTLGLRSAARSHSPTTASPITSRPGRPSTRSKITRRSWTSATDGR
jgi:peptidoglycan/LPS O-acetylase OafA/YrhL